MYNKSPFASWVPKPLMLLIIIGILFPMMTVSGVYSSVLSNVSGAMGTYTEYISLANNAGTIGMGLALTILMRLKMRFRSKEIIAGGAVILAALSYMCGTTEDPKVFIACSFLIGFVKMFPLVEMILPTMFILSPTGDRGRFYALFYPLSIAVGQFSGYRFAKLVFDGSWQSPYLIMSCVMLVIALVSLIFQHNQRFCFKKPLYQIDWLSLVLMGASFMFLNYFLVFMRQQGWFSSPNILGSLGIGIVLLGVVIFRNSKQKRPLFNFRGLYKKPNVLHGFILLMFFGVYLASSSIYVQYSMGALGHNGLINSQTNLWMIPGIVIAGGLAFWGFKNQLSVKYFIATGFFFFFLHTLCLYLLIQPQMNIEYLNYSMVIKGVGFGLLYICIWFYASQNMELDELVGVISILVIIRSFFATALGSAVIGWATYQGQWQSLSDISNYLDVGSFPNGMAIYQNIRINAMLASSKIVLGALCWLVIPILIFIAGHSYGVLNFRRVVLFRKVIRGNSIKGYRLY